MGAPRWPPSPQSFDAPRRSRGTSLGPARLGGVTARLSLERSAAACLDERLVGFGALLGGLAFGADPGAHDDLCLIVASEGPRDERRAAAAGAPLGAGVGGKVGREPRDLGRHRRDDITQTRGSSASRSRSPTRLMASTVLRMARPGKVGSHHATVTKSRPSAIIWPQVG